MPGLLVAEIGSRKGPSIKYVTLFLANFYPSSATLCHTSREPPQKYVTHIGPPIFIRPSTKNPDKSPLYKFSLSMFVGFLSCGFCQRSLFWKVLSGVVFVRAPSVRIHLLQKK